MAANLVNPAAPINDAPHGLIPLEPEINVQRNAFKGIFTAGSVALVAGIVSKVASEMGQRLQNGSIAEALCQEIGSRAHVVGYGALGIVAPLALSFFTHQFDARAHFFRAVQDRPVIDFPTIVPIRVRLEELREEIDKMHTTLGEIAKGALLAAMFGIGMREALLAGNAEGIRRNGEIPLWMKDHIWSKEVYYYGFNPNGSLMTCDVPLWQQIWRRNDFGICNKVIAAAVLGLSVCGIIDDKPVNFSKRLQLSCLLPLISKLTLGCALLRELSWPLSFKDFSKQAMHSLGQQLLRCGVKNAAVGGSSAFAGQALLNLLERYNVNPSKLAKYRLLLQWAPLLCTCFAEFTAGVR
jgi:hypothetical protein